MAAVITILVILSIIGFPLLALWLICRTKYEMFKKPRSFESEYSLFEKDYHYFKIVNIFDKNHAIAKYFGDDYIYVVVEGKFCNLSTVKVKNPMIIGRYYVNDKYLPIITEGEL